MATKILLVDNQPIVYEGLQCSLSETSFEIVATVTSVSDLPEAIQIHQPDVVVAESRFSGQDVLGVLERMFHDPEQMKIVIFSQCTNPTSIARASAINVNDYVPKSAPVDVLVQALYDAIQGKDAGDSSLLVTTRSKLRRPRQSISQDIPLTKRELQVLQHVALGLSNREVGKSLGISVETAKEHVQNILRKLDVNDRTQAAVWAVKRGLA
jgi:DNA-binding NarL/FixJ family response regulator